jgi:hypothetical protein
MPDTVLVPFTEYQMKHPYFRIDQSHNAILLAAIQKVFTTLDDKQTPAFLTLVNNVGRFLEFQLSKSEISHQLLI